MVDNTSLIKIPCNTLVHIVSYAATEWDFLQKSSGYDYFKLCVPETFRSTFIFSVFHVTLPYLYSNTFRIFYPIFNMYLLTDNEP